jgi:hypothetical protein
LNIAYATVMNIVSATLPRRTKIPGMRYFYTFQRPDSCPNYIQQRPDVHD